MLLCCDLELSFNWSNFRHTKPKLPSTRTSDEMTSFISFTYPAFSVADDEPECQGIGVVDCFRVKVNITKLRIEQTLMFPDGSIMTKQTTKTGKSTL